MANILLAYNNVADDATFTAGAASGYPASNLADDNIDKPWRSTGTTLVVKQFRMSLTAAATARALALVKHNLSSGSKVRVRAGTAPLDLDFTNDTTDSRLTSSGGANGTRVNSAGAIGTAATTPRIDFNPAAPDALAARGVLVEAAAENLLLNSTVLSTQDVTVTAVPHTLSFYGTTGTVTLSGASTAGPLVGDGTNNRVTLTFTPSAGTLTLTVTGTVNLAQLEIGSVATSWISTAGAPVTRTADSITITGSDFTAAHSATAGTVYAEFTVNGTSNNVVWAIDDNTVNERLRLVISSGTLRFIVEDGGVGQCDISLGAVAAGTTYKVAVAWSANDFACSIAGGAVQTDSSGSLPTVDRMRVGADTSAAARLNGHIKRIVRWTTRLANADLILLSTSGPGAYDLDSGWVNALQLTYSGTLPTDWGSVYDVIYPFTAAESVRYATVDIYDPVNYSSYVQVGRFFMGSATFQPETNAETGLSDGWADPSTIVRTPTLKKLSSVRPKVRSTAFNFRKLSEAEGDQVHDMLGAVGTTQEVLYLPDPADTAKCQRYGFVGTLEALNGVIYPEYANRSNAFQIEKKQ